MVAGKNSSKTHDPQTIHPNFRPRNEFGTALIKSIKSPTIPTWVSRGNSEGAKRPLKLKPKNKRDYGSQSGERSIPSTQLVERSAPTSQDVHKAVINSVR